MKNIPVFFCLSVIMILCGSCKKKIRQTEDSVYSRHLQQHVKLSILNTPPPDQKNLYNLVILNDGQDIDKLRVKESLDSLSEKDLIQPVVIVGVHPGDRMQEYGVAGSPDYQKNGSDAKKYSDFINNELYPFIKKKTGVRKFASVTIAGCSLGGLSAFDIAWNNADRFDKVGVFSGSFWWRDKDASAADYSDEKNRIMLNEIHSSRKKPHLKYWFYAGGSEEDGDRDKDGIIDVVDDTKDLVNIIRAKNVAAPGDIVYKEIKEGKHDYTFWRQVFPEFLIWAVGNGAR